MPQFTHDTVVKSGSSASDELLCESAGLRWLAEAESDGGIRIAQVYEASRERLVEERIATGAPTRGGTRRIGAALAHMHAAGAPWWGCPPTGCPEEARGIGRALTPWAPRGAASTWGAFFRRVPHDVLRAAAARQRHIRTARSRVAGTRGLARGGGCIRCGAAGTCTRIGHGIARDCTATYGRATYST